MSSNLREGVAIAANMIREHEGLFLRAYPDPLSPYGRELVRLYGSDAIQRFGRGELDQEWRHRNLDGSPWTIGYGQTGPGIRLGLIWTRQQAIDALAESLRSFADRVVRVWVGAERLHPKAIAALISMAYNRGTALNRRPTDKLDRRREMRELQGAVLHQDYAEMARLFRSMKRLWEGKGMGGLIRRREDEAKLCEEAMS